MAAVHLAACSRRSKHHNYQQDNVNSWRPAATDCCPTSHFMVVRAFSITLLFDANQSGELMADSLIQQKDEAVITASDKTNSKPTAYIDVNSEELRDILRMLLQEVNWISLGGDKPAFEQSLLFHYLPELEAYRANRKSVRAFDLLIQTRHDPPREYAVEDIEHVQWSNQLFTSLTIPARKKEVVMAVAQNRLGEPGSGSVSTTKAFDGIAGEKGRGIDILLFGPPGVGKTFTAEALSEHFHRPLYLISAGELCLDAAELEWQLGRIFQTVKARNVLLLLDEADVFLQARFQLTLERNRLVAIFLRRMGFFNGVFFLSTDLTNDFDGAILNRIHLRMKYEDLDKKARQVVIAQSLKKVREGGGSSSISMEDLEPFACVQLNGREIRNTIATANDLASGKGDCLSFSHISHALTANSHFIPEASLISVDDSLYE
ncbi:hypothetical protein Z517_11744 [Fonsecaea pedrosoi CBS 271.37]|uniref:AAA+ ATPase domain-containing protein n=1 Tax=Fonsecaea pedrosoi CBS 271.37 TaxID=1442368 RepID=A0A0D2G2K0_9EURO|nr:uncharacterized protein Z517_11744 [Fonsecaea pedrosoi CBS 271.37]KIW74973.1 hypothetical protein Z517_11744 [Fonsecaea pedrosoi CBS 271.37]